MTRIARGEPDLPPGPARDLVALFRRLRTRTPLTVGQIAVKSKLTASHVSEVLRGWKAPSPDAAGAIASALGANEDAALRARRLAEDLAELNRYNRAKARTGPHASEPGPSPAVYLRRRLRDFHGRDREVARVTRMLREREQAAAIVVLYGMGGVGKTTIANETAHRLGAEFGPARIFADLGGAEIAAVRIERAFRQVFYAFGVPEADIPRYPSQQEQLLQQLLARGPCLLILDNVTHAEHVAPLLPAVPGAAALVTSRSPLLALDGARRVNILPMPGRAGVGLFHRVLDRDEDQADPDAARRIVELADGLPLAIRIAAALASGPAMRGQPLGALVTRLEAESLRLAGFEDGERGVRASFDISYRALPPEVARFFEILGLLPTQEPDLEFTAAAAQLPVAAAQALAKALVNAQLIDTVGPFGRRYRMHDLVRLYAKEIGTRAHGGEFRTALLDRVLDWYTAAAGRVLDAAAPHHPADAALDWFAREHANAVAVARAAHEAADWARLGTLCQAMRSLFWYGKRWEELAVTEEWAVEAAHHTGDWRAELDAIIYLAEARRGAGRPQTAADLYERARQISRRGGDPRVEAWVTTHYGDSFLDSDDPEQAIGHYEAALALYRSVADEAAELWLAAHFIDAYLAAGRLGDAIRTGEEGLALARRRNDRPNEIWVRWHLALAYREVGRFGEAIEALEAAVDDSRARRDQGAATHMLMLLGETQQDAGLASAAEATLGEALRLAQGVGIRPLAERIADSLGT